MNLATHQLAKTPINELMASDAALTDEIGRDDPSCEVRLIVGFNMNQGARKPGTYQFGDFFWMHERYDAIP